MASPRGLSKFNIVVMGDQYCGKTSLIERYTRGRFDPNYILTIGSEFYNKSICLNGVDVQLRVFDTAGQENMKTVIRSVYRMAQGIVLVFDFTRKDTLQHINAWVDLIETNCDIVPELILVGNKVDLPENKLQVKTNEAIMMAKHHDMKFLEVSAMKNYNVDKMFQQIATAIYFNRKRLYPNELNTSIKLHEKVKNDKACCLGGH